MKDFLAKLKSDYPEFTFKPGSKFSFHPPDTITYIDFSSYLDEIQGKTEHRKRAALYMRQARSGGFDDEIHQIGEKYALLTLHELSHAILKHKDYIQLVKLVKIEAEAWGKTRELALKYHITFDEDFAEAKLDTYRHHLHQKSLCPACRQPRPQKTTGAFHCPLCDQ
jgi:hypothetical protein